MKLIFVVDGEDFEVQATGSELLSQVRDEVLARAHVAGCDFADFVVRDEDGVDLPASQRVDHFEDGGRFFVERFLGEPCRPVRGGEYHSFVDMLRDVRRARDEWQAPPELDEDPRRLELGYRVGSVRFFCRLRNVRGTCPKHLLSEVTSPAKRLALAMSDGV